MKYIHLRKRFSNISFKCPEADPEDPPRANRPIREGERRAVMVSMKDIARECGVSVATVSKALNNRDDVNPVTRERVQEAAKALGDDIELEPDGSVVWRLSDRERELIASLG